ncbi:MAG: sterol desaturase family protein [Pseudomonadota bacterium]
MDFIAQIPDLFSDFINPGKRIFAGYVLLAVLIAFVFLILIRGQSARSALGRIFDPKILFSRSSFADVKIFVLNRFVTFFISPLLITQIAIATAIYFALHRQDVLSSGLFDDAPVALIVGLFTTFMFLMDDFTKYLVHRWMHRWPMLWSFHKVHHSATTLTPLTVYRTHPVEGTFFAVRSAVAQGVTISLFIFLFGSGVDLYTIFGANLLVFLFHVTGSNLRHSHIDIRYWPWLEHILISPAQHQVHHSVAEEHYDKNFGAALAVWDWAFGSLHLSEHDSALEFGLDASENSSEADVVHLYFMPIKEFIMHLLASIKSLYSDVFLGGIKRLRTRKST